MDRCLSRMAHSPQTATLSPAESTETHRIGTPGARVRKPLNSFCGYVNVRAILSTEPVNRAELCPSAVSTLPCRIAHGTRKRGDLIRVIVMETRLFIWLLRLMDTQETVGTARKDGSALSYIARRALTVRLSRSIAWSDQSYAPACARRSRARLPYC